MPDTITKHPILKMNSSSLAALFILALLLSSCQQGPEQLIKGKWRGTRLHNPRLDSFFHETQHYIDTITKARTTEENLAIYGVTNTDSLKQALQLQHDSTMAMQRDAVKNTWFQFMDDSVAIVSFNGNADTGKWHIENKVDLIIEEIDGTGTAQRTKMNIDSLTGNKLKLRFDDENYSSTVTFVKE
ncbi:MAG: hypothetical protein EBZ77_06005 [Chitinophagia bacterium]|nr:hypothetical protein [Chitinophagia bacterium]